MKIFKLFRNACGLLVTGRFFRLFRETTSLLIPSRFVSLKNSLIFRLDKSKRPPRRSCGEIEILRGDAELVSQSVRDLYADSPSSHTFYERFYRDGVEPFFARHDGKIVGVIWVYTGVYEFAWECYDKGRLNIEVEPTAKFFANEFVAPEARRRGISTMIAEAIFDIYPDSEFYTCIDESNDPPILSREKLGFQRCCSIYFVRVGRTVRCLFRPKTGKKRFFRLVDGQSVDVSLL